MGCWHDAHNQSEDNSQKNPREKFFMMNQATSHLGALSSLMNNESSNRRRQPKIGTAFTFEWWLAHEWVNASKEQRMLWNANKGTLWRWSIKEGGTYISNQVKIACISSNLKKTFAQIFDLLQEDSQWSPTRLWTERIIESIITKKSV